MEEQRVASGKRMLVRSSTLALLVWVSGGLVVVAVLVSTWSLVQGEWSGLWSLPFLVGYVWIYLGFRRRRSALEEN